MLKPGLPCGSNTCSRSRPLTLTYYTAFSRRIPMRASLLEQDPAVYCLFGAQVPGFPARIELFDASDENRSRCRAGRMSASVQETIQRGGIGEMKRAFVAFGAVVALAAGPAMAQNSVKIGFINTFSGPTAVIGNDMRNSF